MTMVDLDKVLKAVISLRTYDDVVPVVRCRDCMNLRETKDGFYRCEEWNDLTELESYCSYGISAFDRDEKI